MINLWVSPSEYEQLPEKVKTAMNLSAGTTALSPVFIRLERS